MSEPIPMLLWCPECRQRHVDVGAFAARAHHTHACQHCGHCWRPAVVPTVGVQFLPGFSDAPSLPPPPVERTVEELYQELLYAVGRKYPGESRHQTALRYIQNAENAQTVAVTGASALKDLEVINVPEFLRR